MNKLLLKNLESSQQQENCSRHHKKIIKRVNKSWDKIIFIDKYIESEVSFKIALLVPSAGPISSFEVSP